MITDALVDLLDEFLHEDDDDDEDAADATPPMDLPTILAEFGPWLSEETGLPARIEGKTLIIEADLAALLGAVGARNLQHADELARFADRKERDERGA